MSVEQWVTKLSQHFYPKELLALDRHGLINFRRVEKQP